MTTSEQTTPRDVPGYGIQTASGDDLPYVLSTWGRIVEKRLEATPQPGFLKAFAPLQAKIIKRSKVACAYDSNARILGLIVYEPGLLHWISVRETERAKGIGRGLLQHAELVKPTITFWTSDLRHLGLADAPFTPFWLRI